MADKKGYQVRRVPVASEPLVEGTYDYADSFELRLEQSDTHTAEQWVRTALEQAAPGVRGLVRFVHGRVAKFGLDSSPHSVLGWRTVASTRDVFHLAAAGPVLRAEIVARRTSPVTATLTTFLFYERRRTRLLWLVVGPLHRRVAPYLLTRAASRLTSADANV